ncbi:MAG: BspA family leucine-rich repeat surface protein [Eubacteriales bacterium]|nr:BspA family leucine-rich repeat surface protein [Eubacteriales bacterium]
MNIGEKYYCSKCMMEIEDEIICPYCGHDPETSTGRIALEEGTLLCNRRYQIGSILGTGGFGITYAAWDYTLSQAVAIKEYFPFDYASRDVWESNTVLVDENDENIFQIGLQRFSREARILATLQNIKSVVTVFDWFEANGTAYIVMEFVRGKTIDQYVTENNVSPQRLIEMLRDLVDSLVSIHAQGVLHRDISPSNIMVQGDGIIKLIDFGAAVVEERRAQGKDRTVVFNRKFAPVEQYDEEGLQGPWTDVYALSATIYYLITGKYPQEAMARRGNDTLRSLRSQKIHLKKWQEKAIQEGMILDPEKRIQSMNIFRSYLYHLPVPEEIRMKRRLICQYAVGNIAALAIAGLAAFCLFRNPGLESSHILMDVEREDFKGESLPYDVSGLDIHVFGNSSYNRNEIKSITFLDSMENTGEDTWDVSEDGSGGVVAWVKENGDLYDLYIAADGEVLSGENCKDLFACFENIEYVNFNDCFNTSDAVSMENMFYRCRQIRDLDLSGIDTSSVTSMNEMFYYCQSIEKLDVSDLDTSSVTDMYGMFYHCEKLITLDISGFNTEKVEDFRCMFSGCENIVDLNLENISTVKADKMDAMFKSCRKLIQADISGFDITGVTSMVGMFSECSSLEKLNLGNFYAPKLENMASMFKECSSLTELNFNGILMGRLKDMDNLFMGCEKLISLDLGEFDTSSVKNMRSVFRDCKSLQEVNLSGWDTSNVESMFDMFMGCEKLTGIDLSMLQMENLENMSFMFCDCVKLKTIHLPEESAGRLTDMAKMFQNCSSLISVDMSRFQVPAVEDVSFMFKDCINLKEVNLQGIHTENVTNMSSMFRGCASLEELNLNYFDTSSVRDMSWMFYECINLKKLDISNFDTLELRHMEYMFGGCSNLSVVDLSGFVIAEDSIIFDTGMFYGCKNLEDLDVSGFDFRSTYQEDYALTETLWDGMTLKELKKEQSVAQ